MNYTKPVVILSANAVEVVQGGTPKQALNADADGVQIHATPNAYEADE